MTGTFIFDADNHVSVYGAIRVVDFSGNSIDPGISTTAVLNQMNADITQQSVDLQNYYNGASFSVTGHLTLTDTNGPGVLTIVVDTNAIIGAFASVTEDKVYVQVDSLITLNPVNSSKGPHTYFHEWDHRAGAGDKSMSFDGDIMDGGTGSVLSTLDVMSW